MRTIKFRAMNADGYWEYFDLAQLFQSGAPITTFVGDYRERRWWGEWTGLHDKHGKEIWEGDIIGVVVKKTGHGGHDFIKSVVEYGQDQYHRSAFTGKFWTDGSTWCEVLGNIYSNPELLEAK